MFPFLVLELATENDFDCTFLVTHNEQVLFNDSDIVLNSICPSSHEEANPWIILHCKHAADCGFETATNRIVDSDVIVIAIALFPDLKLKKL